MIIQVVVLAIIQLMMYLSEVNSSGIVDTGNSIDNICDKTECRSLAQIKIKLKINHQFVLVLFC